jgi:hypothetical protein
MVNWLFRFALWLQQELLTQFLSPVSSLFTPTSPNSARVRELPPYLAGFYFLNNKKTPPVIGRSLSIRGRAEHAVL